MKQNAVNRFEGNALVVNIHELNKRKASRMAFLLFFGHPSLQLQPAASGGRETVVPVADRKTEAFASGNGFGQLPGGFPMNSLTTDMPAAAHQIKIIKQIFGRSFRLLHHQIIRIVKEEHDMRHFHACFPAHLDAGREPILHRMLGGADRGIRMIRKVECLQVDHTDQSAARAPAGQLALQINQTVRKNAKNV